MQDNNVRTMKLYTQFTSTLGLGTLLARLLAAIYILYVAIQLNQLSEDYLLTSLVLNNEVPGGIVL